MRYAAGALALVALLLPGCGGGPPPRVDLGEGPRPENVARVVRERSTSFRTVELSMKLTWESPDGEREGCRASLFYVANRTIRLIGTSATFFEVFDLVATDERVWLDVPREDFTIFGRREDPAWQDLVLSPDRLLVALLADPCPWAPCLEGSLAVRAGSPPVLIGAGWELTFDPETGLPGRLREDDFEVTWEDWAPRSGIPWPHVIEIRAGEGEGTLRIDVGRVRPDRKIEERVFRFETEDGREILSPTDAARRWVGLGP